MEDLELRQKLDVLERKIDAAFIAADKTRKYMMWTGIVSIALIVLPAIGLLFAIPSFLSSYGNLGSYSDPNGGGADRLQNLQQSLQQSMQGL